MELCGQGSTGSKVLVASHSLLTLLLKTPLVRSCYQALYLAKIVSNIIYIALKIFHGFSFISTIAHWYLNNNCSPFSKDCLGQNSDFHFKFQGFDCLHESFSTVFFRFITQLDQFEHFSDTEQLSKKGKKISFSKSKENELQNETGYQRLR